MTALLTLLVALFFTPAPVFAATVTGTPILLVNTFVGVYLTIILLTLAVSFVVYFGRLGTWPSYRDESIKIMIWATAMLFTLVIVVAIARFFENQPERTMRILGFAAAAAIIYLVLKVLAASQHKEPEKPAAKK